MSPPARPSRLKRHLDVLGYVLKIVVPTIVRTGKRPVMFSKYSGMGDIICTFPAVFKLKAKHPGAPVIYNCHELYAVLPKLAGVTDRVTHFPDAGVLKHWYGRLFTAFYEFPCADELAGDFCKDYVVKEYAHDHGVEVEAEHPRLEIAPAVRQKVTTMLEEARKDAGPIVLFQTGPTWPIREWPRQSWETLVADLRRNGYSNILQIGTDNHLSVGAAAAPSVAGAVSFINRFTLEETAAAISAAQLFIGIDSGLLHMASALRIPCVGIFGPTSPRLRLPPQDVQNCVVSGVECQGCHHRVPRIHWEKNCPHDIKCMKTLSAADVLQACLRLLRHSPAC